MKHPLKLESVNVQIRVNLFQERTACDIDKSQVRKRVFVIFGVFSYLCSH